MATLMNTYGTRNTTLTKGIGSSVWDQDNNRYLDAISGIAVCGLGYSHTKVTEAIRNQAETLLHVSNLYNIPAQQQLGDQLCNISGMDKVFFSNSGAEANEAAIKIARKYGNDQGITSPSIIVMEKSFHGRTLATLSATGNSKVQEGFSPLVEGFIRVPFNDTSAVKKLASEQSNIVAILVEPIQGEGGVNVPSSTYLNELREICNKHDWLLMLDEIQTGNGRTGKYFSYQHNHILPDVVTTAKGLGNGVPIGACLAVGKAADVLQPGNHGSTFGGNPLACSAALAVLEVLMTNDFLAQIEMTGEKIVKAFDAAFAKNDTVVNVRGKGLMIGIELNRPCTELVTHAREQGLLINVASENTIRLLPTFIMTNDEIDLLINKIIGLVNQF